MPLFHIVILALVQGLTEFLPVSSSAHLILTHKILGSDGGDDDLIMDIAVHVGTLMSVLFYFRKDLFMIAGRRDWRFVVLLAVASLPVVLAGLALHVFEPVWIRGVPLLAVTLIIFGALLWVVDRNCPMGRQMRDIGWKEALVIGLAQVLSLMPGTSRSGITMTAGRWLGLSRVEAARFSLLLGIIAISGAGVVGGLGLLEMQSAQLTVNAMVAAAFSFLAGWAAIAFMMRWLAKATFAPFAIYRILLGLLLLGLLQAGVIAGS